MTQYKGIQTQTNGQTLQMEFITKSLTHKNKSYMQLKQKHIALYRIRNYQLMSKKCVQQCVTRHVREKTGRMSWEGVQKEKGCWC